MWTKYPTPPVVRALGPEIIRCSNPVPSYPFDAFSQVYFLRDERAYKLYKPLFDTVSLGVVFYGVAQSPSSRGP